MIIIIPDNEEVSRHALMEHIKDIVAEKDRLESDLLKLKHSLNLSLTIFYDLFGKEYGALSSYNKDTKCLVFPTFKEKSCGKAIKKKMDSYAVLNIEIESIDKTIKELEDRYRKRYNRSFFKYRI